MPYKPGSRPHSFGSMKLLCQVAIEFFLDFLCVTSSHLIFMYHYQGFIHSGNIFSPIMVSSCIVPECKDHKTNIALSLCIYVGHTQRSIIDGVQHCHCCSVAPTATTTLLLLTAQGGQRMTNLFHPTPRSTKKLRDI